MPSAESRKPFKAVGVTMLRMGVDARVTGGTDTGMKAVIKDRIAGSVAVIEGLRGHAQRIAEIATAVATSLESGGTLYTAGNGGSAAHALHLAEELTGRYRADRAPLAAVCLAADAAALTCIANDFGFEEVFARQCTALLKKRDALLVLSTSGDSPNVVRALEVARDRRVATIGLLGRSGGCAAALCDHCLVVDSTEAAHIQEAHQVVVHLICEIVERGVVPNE